MSHFKTARCLLMWLLVRKGTEHYQILYVLRQPVGREGRRGKKREREREREMGKNGGKIEGGRRKG